jgi:hypothetical protein
MTTNCQPPSTKPNTSHLPHIPVLRHTTTRQVAGIELKQCSRRLVLHRVGLYAYRARDVELPLEHNLPDRHVGLRAPTRVRGQWGGCRCRQHPELAGPPHKPSTRSHSSARSPSTPRHIPAACIRLTYSQANHGCPNGAH